MTRGLSIVGVPSSAGAYAPGQERAPAAFRTHDLPHALAIGGRRIVDRGDTRAFRWRPDLAHPKAMNVEAAAAVAGDLADRVAAALDAGDDVLVLGGDCTVELGTTAGALRGCASVGLIYVDLDTDLNPPDDGDGALDWTGVAHLLDLPGAEAALAGLGPRRPMLASADLLFVGVDNVTDKEQATIDRDGIAVIRLAEVHRDMAGVLRRAWAWARRYERVLVHCDVDVLAFTDFPIAENTRRQNGLGFDELGRLLKGLVRLPNWRALTLTEINPDHAPDEAEAFARLNAMLAEAMRP